MKPLKSQEIKAQVNQDTLSYKLGQFLDNFFILCLHYPCLRWKMREMQS